VTWHPDGRFVEVLGRRVHLVDVGTGPPVLLLHGFLHSSSTWRHCLRELAGEYRLLAPDQIGTGESSRGPWDWSISGLMRIVEALLAALQVETLHAAVGSSLGGATVARLALHAPRRVRRLVLVDSVGGGRHAFPLPVQHSGHPAIESMVSWLASRPRVGRALLGRIAYRRIPVDDEVLEGFTRGFVVPGTFAAAAGIARALPPGSAALSRRLHEIPQPTLVIWGAKDPLIPLRIGRRMASRIPGARQAVLPDSGHCPQEEDPGRFVELLRGFLLSDLEQGARAVRPSP